MTKSPVPAALDQNVLAVVDDSAFRSSLQFALELDGFLVKVFETGDMLLQLDPLPGRACLVIDYVLPRTDGIEIVNALRERGIDFPTILMATNPPLRLRRQVFEAGLGLIEKPLLGNHLSEAIRSALAGRDVMR